MLKKLIVPNLRILVFFVLLISLLSSCSTKKEFGNLVYLNQSGDPFVQQLNTPYSLKIKPDDELQINISSTVLQATSIYNLPAVNYIGRTDTEMKSNNAISTYVVSESGDIVIPNIGRISVVGKTTDEIAQIIIDKISNSVKDPIVKVDLKGFTVAVLGAVSSPGTKSFSSQRCSVFDALGAAEDITLYGRKDNVVLLRESEGKVQKHILDLTDTSFINSPYFYLQQNDVLIVDATDIQKENSTYNTMNSFRLQTTATIVSALSVLTSLCIAIFIK